MLKFVCERKRFARKISKLDFVQEKPINLTGFENYCVNETKRLILSTYHDTKYLEDHRYK